MCLIFKMVSRVENDLLLANINEIISAIVYKVEANYYKSLPRICPDLMCITVLNWDNLVSAPVYKLLIINKLYNFNVLSTGLIIRWS